MTSRWTATLLLAAALLGAAACGDSDTVDADRPAATSEKSDDHGDEKDPDEGGTQGDNDNEGSGGGTSVVVKGIAFKPAEITVAKGDTVTWKFEDGSIPHNVKFDFVTSDNFTEGEFEYTFDQAGSFDYICTIHPTMKGTVTVE